MISNGNGGPKVPVSAASIGIVVALLAQAGGLVIWATNEHNARIVLEERVRELQMRAEALNRGQDEKIGRIDDFIRREGNQQSIVNTTTNSRFENINGHLTRLDDRVQRIVEALDSFYKQFVDHLKEKDGK